MLPQLAQATAPSLSLIESQKRHRTSLGMVTSPNRENVVLPELPHLTLGPSASALGDSISPLGLYLRLDDKDDSFQDNASAEELAEFDETTCSVHSLGDQSSMPLLTPPASPTQLVKGKDDQSFEWASNTVVESLRASAMELTPLTPQSLQKQEDGLECNRLAFDPLLSPEVEKRPLILTPPSTGLTPRLQGIQVSFKKSTA